MMIKGQEHLSCGHSAQEAPAQKLDTSLGKHDVLYSFSE